MRLTVPLLEAGQCSASRARTAGRDGDAVRDTAASGDGNGTVEDAGAPLHMIMDAHVTAGIDDQIASSAMGAGQRKLRGMIHHRRPVSLQAMDDHTRLRHPTSPPSNDLHLRGSCTAPPVLPPVASFHAANRCEHAKVSSASP